jgi:hypothetical protein
MKENLPWHYSPHMDEKIRKKFQKKNTGKTGNRGKRLFNLSGQTEPVLAFQPAAPALPLLPAGIRLENLPD